MATRTWKPAVTDWGAAASWVEGNVPVTGDAVFIPAGTLAPTTNLAQSAVTLASLTIDPGHTAAWAAYLAIGATLVNLPDGTGTGAQPWLNLGSTAGTVTIAKTANATPAVRLLGTAITLNALAGQTGIAFTPGETATVATARLSNGGVGDPTVICGGGCTISDATISSGTLISYSTATAPAVEVQGGTYDYRGTGAHTQLNVDRGTCYYSGSGVLNGNTNLSGTLDFSRSQIARVITNPVKVYAGASLIADTRFVTAAAGAALAVSLQRCRIDDLRKLSLGTNLALTALAS